MRSFRLMLRAVLATGVLSFLAGVSGLVYWLGTGCVSIPIVAGSGLLLVSGLAAVASSLILESAEAELRRLRRERELLMVECDSNRTRVRRLERRAESLSIVREIHRSTNIITRSERLRQILTVIGQLAGDVEATLFALRECVPGAVGTTTLSARPGEVGTTTLSARPGEVDQPDRLRPVAYLKSCDSNELFLRFDRAFTSAACISIADAVTTTNGSRREIAGDLVAEGEVVGRIEAVLVSGDGFGVAPDAAPEDVLAWLLGGADLDCDGPRSAFSREEVVRSRDSFDFGGADGIEFFYPLTAEGEAVGAFRLRVAEREVEEAGGLGELDEMLSECARHVALALKKETDADRAITDGLTGLLLKREFEPRLGEAFGKAVEARQPMALLMVDIDHFKIVNDTYGHHTGDLVLRGVAALVRRHVRARDCAFRYGGEELCLVLPGTGAREAKAIAERLRESVESARFTSEVGLDVGVTISIGLATLNPRRPLKTSARRSPEGSSPAMEPAEMFRRADAALYRAKATGRNRVVVWTSRMRAWTNTASLTESEKPRRGPRMAAGSCSRTRMRRSA